MRVSIHQPNLVPHERLLQKIAAADVHVILAHVQFNRDGYQHRFRHEDRWYTMAVRRGHLKDPICVKEYLDPDHDWRSFGLPLPGVELHRKLAVTNVRVLRTMMAQLGITTPLQWDFPTHLGGTGRLVELCQHYNATTYLSGPSGRKYLDESLFTEAGIAVEYQEGGPTRSGLEVLRDGL